MEAAARRRMLQGQPPLQGDVMEPLVTEVEHEIQSMHMDNVSMDMDL